MTNTKARLAAAVALAIFAVSSCESGTESTQTDAGNRGRPVPAVSLPCGNAIESFAAPAGDRAVVFGRVELPTRTALGVAPANTGPDFPLFAKDGLVIKAGKDFELIVPEGERSRLRIGWGSPTTRLEVAGCQPIDPSKPWLAYAGGYFVNERACVSVVVKAGDQTRRLRIGVGAACPGQPPPPRAQPP